MATTGPAVLPTEPQDGWSIGVRRLRVLEDATRGAACAYF